MEQLSERINRVLAGKATSYDAVVFAEVLLEADRILGNIEHTMPEEVVLPLRKLVGSEFV